MERQTRRSRTQAKKGGRYHANWNKDRGDGGRK